ncbi:MAG: hypothetical protein K2Y27_34985 [Xanthobacteraceae bacterium]|nr:hypothetical protein [Xanthobacteraceae bacterium]
MSGIFDNDEDDAAGKLKRAGSTADKTIFTAPATRADDAAAQVRPVLFSPPERPFEQPPRKYLLPPPPSPPPPPPPPPPPSSPNEYVKEFFPEEFPPTTTLSPNQVVTHRARNPSMRPMVVPRPGEDPIDALKRELKRRRR